MPFDALYSLIIAGTLLDKGSISEETALGVLGGIYIIVLICVAAVNAFVYGCKECTSISNENEKSKKEKRKKCIETLKQIGLFFVDVGIVGAVTATYFVGDNINEATPGEDLTVQSIIILLVAKLGFRIVSAVKKYFENLFKSEEPKDDSPKQFSESIYYATLRTLSLVPEVDATYTIFINVVNLMSDNCRMRNYNVLWVIYGGILVILIFEMSYAFFSTFRIHTEYLKLQWVIYSIIVIFLGFVGIGFFFVADNEQPLDCSSTYHNIPDYRPTKMPVTVTLHEDENYGLRIGFLCVTIVFSLAILTLAGICWIYFLYKFYNEKDKDQGATKGNEIDMKPGTTIGTQNENTTAETEVP